MKFKLEKISLFAVITSAFLFVGCSETPKPDNFTSLKTVYKVGVNSVEHINKDVFENIVKNSRYGIFTDSNSYGVKWSTIIEDGKAYLVLDYINSIADLEGLHQNIVEIKVPYKIVKNEFKETILFSSDIEIENIKDDIDMLDNLDNIKDDVRTITGTVDYTREYVDTIDFDPKKVKFGVAGNVRNGKLDSDLKEYDGYVSTVCSYDNGCTYDTYYQSIDVLLKDNLSVHIVQSITDDRYDFIHHGDKVYLFQMENGKWIVKPQVK